MTSSLQDTVCLLLDMRSPTPRLSGVLSWAKLSHGAAGDAELNRGRGLPGGYPWGSGSESGSSRAGSQSGYGSLLT